MISARLSKVGSRLLGGAGRTNWPMSLMFSSFVKAKRTLSSKLFPSVDTDDLKPVFQLRKDFD